MVLLQQFFTSEVLLRRGLFFSFSGYGLWIVPDGWKRQ